MTFVALLDNACTLARMLADGDRPLAVVSRRRAVCDMARTHGIATVGADELYTRGERIVLQDHVDDLTTALAGHVVPERRDYASWAWWALEFPLAVTLSHGARLRRMLDAALAVAPDAVGVAHDYEGGSSGVTINLYARALGRTPIGLPRGAYEGMHGIQDMVMSPLPSDGAREHWRGRLLPRDDRPGLVVFHANEVAQVFEELRASPAFRVLQDARDPWPFAGAGVDADPIGPPLPLSMPAWPAGLTTSAAPWERELAELMFVTWQPFLRETTAWTEAAYAAGDVGGLLAAQDCLPHMRCRVLACRWLGIPTFLLQHGADLGNRAGGKGDRTHYFADHSLVWSRGSGRDLLERGIRGTVEVVGWPQSATPHARASQAERRPGGASAPWVVLTSGTASDNAEVHYDTGDRYLRDVLRVLRAADPERPIVVKCHPFHDRPDVIAALCAELGIGNGTVVTARDPWETLAGAHAVVAPKSTTALCAHALSLPLVVYYPFEDDAWYDRFADVIVARTPAALADGLAAAVGRTPAAGHGHESAATRYRTDTRPGARIAAAIRRRLRRRARAGAAALAA